MEILEIVNPLYWITSNLSNKFSQLDILRFALLDLYNGYLSLNIFIFFSFEIISKIKVRIILLRFFKQYFLFNIINFLFLKI